MRYVFRCTVRFDDLDAFGHVNNVTFVEYLQEARVDWAHAFGASPKQGQVGAVVAHQSIDYLRPLPFRTQPVDVVMWVTAIRRTSYDVAYEVRDAETVFARATGTYVGYDLVAQVPRRLGQVELDALHQYFEP